MPLAAPPPGQLNVPVVALARHSHRHCSPLLLPDLPLSRLAELSLSDEFGIKNTHSSGICTALRVFHFVVFSKQTPFKVSIKKKEAEGST